jgi:phage FluMu protein Com
MIFITALTLGLYFGLRPGPTSGLLQKYPKCVEIQSAKSKKENLKRLGDGTCNRLITDNVLFGLNTPECGFDDGDCIDFNRRYAKCDIGGLPAYKLSDLGRGACKNKYNRAECDFDIKLCNRFNRDFPECKVPDPAKVADGKCDVGVYNVETCNFDGQDCIIQSLPRCTGVDINLYNDKKCQRELNTKRCNFDGGDCEEFDTKYPNCDVPKPFYVFDDICDTGIYNTPECGMDGGACKKHNIDYPGCNAEETELLGDDKCHNIKNQNSIRCDFDGGDCTKENLKYPKCKAVNLWALGNEKCEQFVQSTKSGTKEIYEDGAIINSADCGFDGGDCIEFNRKYPSCTAKYPYKIGDKVCDADLNNRECGFDGGDCNS